MSTSLLTDIWPFFGLTISTPRLTLAYPTDDAIPLLVALADNGIHSTEASPFGGSWSLDVPEKRATSIAQFHWKARSSISPDGWSLPFAVIVDGTIVGTQDAFAKDFAATKVATTGSWLGLEHQGQGIGTEMRRAILHFLFSGLGAEIAHTEAFSHNVASQRVTQKLGYEPNGETIAVRGDEEPERTIRFRLERSKWSELSTNDISIEGLAPCLPLLGL